MSPTALPSAEIRLERNAARSTLLARNWGLIALRGVCAILFGILTFALPGLTLVTLVYLFVGYLLVDGIAAIVSAVRAAQKHERWGWLILEGLVDIAAAVAAVLSPGLAILFFVYLIAVWSVMSGAFMAVAAFQLHLDLGRWLMVAAGVASIIFGALLAFAPIAGAVVLATWLGAYAVVFGVMLVVLAFQLRKRVPASGTAA